MKKYIITLLSTIVSLTIYNKCLYANNLISKCIQNTPSNKSSVTNSNHNKNNLPITIKSDSNNLMSKCIQNTPSNKSSVTNSNHNKNNPPITIKSNFANGTYPKYIEFNGNVNLQQGNSNLHADKIRFHKKQLKNQDQDKVPIHTIDALGHVHYDDNQIILKGKKVWTDLNTKDINVWNGEYQLVGRQGRGAAEKIKLRNYGRYTIMENGSFTSCLPNFNSWSIVGSTIIQDREEELAKIWNARFKIGNIPIFYSPYLQLPTGDHRRSGFLSPSFNYDVNNGFKLQFPYYWNIASQADVTIIPQYITNRGLYLQNEFRYLTHFGQGILNLNYLPFNTFNNHFKKHNEESQNSVKRKFNNYDKWLFYWHHDGLFNQHWRFNLNYTRISNPNYLKDFDYINFNDVDGKQQLNLYNTFSHWDSTFSIKDFQIFDRNNKLYNLYRAIPQLDVNYQNNIGPFNIHIYSQAVKFKNVNRYMPQTTRLHFEPTINFPFFNNWIRLNSQFKLLATSYKQDGVNYYNNNIKSNNINSLNHGGLLKTSVSRILPEFKIDSYMFLDRQITKGYTQTIEPHVQYLYIPYCDQNNIYLYDSKILQTNYNSLFRDRTYSGLDRITSANELRTGVTTRIYDNNFLERFRLSVGQAYSFDPYFINKKNMNRNEGNSKITWASNTYWQINDYWKMSAELRYNTQFNNILQGNTIIDYHVDNNRTLQLSYRYTNPKYVSEVINHPKFLNNLYNSGVSQLGITAKWPIINDWSMVGSYYYDLHNNRSIEQLLSIQYNSCCYAIRLGYKHKSNILDNNNIRDDNQISFNIELRGFNTHDSSNENDIFRHPIIPYQSTAF
ncbi:LPS assembly protein LptD [Pantoea sp. Aalb]|uniref:LPS assembly protein LptD n=1 Tax=Pantoea sp. Aalb TaxID=2576762 RepID=UPI001321EADA|nr:LPS assembly protein LptD [Pantoea sp. Aalb]MXP67171.1 LPS assembly protein LptD [Pantoea sp. Aalb]